MLLPNLLEEIPHPDKKVQKAFWDSIHHWRCYLYDQWKRSNIDDISDESLGYAVDQLIGFILFLEHCKRYEYFDIELSQFANAGRDETLETLQRRIVDSIPCPILKKVFTPSNHGNLCLPSTFLENKCEQRIRHSVWSLIHDHPVPLWLFGDYHQICVANPHGIFGNRKRSSRVRYARGIHYTPAPIVDYLTTTVLNDDLGSDFPGVLDPSCGCGSFLIAAFRHLVEKKQKNETLSNQTRLVLEILEKSLFGVDVDSQAVGWTIRLLYLEAKRLIGTNENGLARHVVPDLSKNILSESFFDADRESFGGRITTILGGPPFVRFGELKKNQPEFVQHLKKRFSSIKTGQFDLYMPFIEHSVNLLVNGGKIGFSLSNTFLHTNTGKEICRFLLNRCTPREVLEFSGGSIYPEASVQIALLRLVVGKDRQDRGKYVFLEPTADIRASLELVYSSESLPASMGKITLLNENELIPNVASTSPSFRGDMEDWIRFGDLPVEFFSGATSKSDEIFMLKDHGVCQGVQYGRTRKLKEKVHCEKELAVPIIRGREIKGFRYSPVKYFYLAPYVKGAFIDWKALEEKYPLTFYYLKPFHDSFVQMGLRDWHAYYTPPPFRQGEAIVSCRIASQRSFARMKLFEKTIHGSAFGIAITDERIDACLLLLYLNSRLFWGQINATMPPMGVGRRAIRTTIFKDLLIPKQIAFPTEENTRTAHALEKRVVRAVGRKNSDEIQSVFSELDKFIESISF